MDFEFEALGRDMHAVIFPCNEAPTAVPSLRMCFAEICLVDIYQRKQILSCTPPTILTVQMIGSGHLSHRRPPASPWSAFHRPDGGEASFRLANAMAESLCGAAVAYGWTVGSLLREGMDGIRIRRPLS